MYSSNNSSCPSQVLSLKVRLQGPVVDDYISEGVVQVEHEGTWGYICPSQWTQFNSHVLCGQLGFPDAEELESHTKTIQDLEPVYWLDQVTCRGWESSIVSCDHSGWGPKQCEEGGAVRIECTRRREDKVSWSQHFIVEGQAIITKPIMLIFKSKARIVSLSFTGCLILSPR